MGEQRGPREFARGREENDRGGEFSSVIVKIRANPPDIPKV